MTLQDYLRDPCGVLSIPYWKAQTVQMPVLFLLLA